MTAPADTLLMLSGGVDSTWCLWQRVQQGLVTRTHHVIYADPDGRQDVEAKAVRDVLTWMDDNGGRGLITHTESAVDLGDLRPIGMWNSHVWAHWIGIVMWCERDIQNVIVGVTADDLRVMNADSREYGNRVYRVGVQTVAGWCPNFVHPAEHLRKASLIASMPTDLVDLCWSCRHPVDGMPCHSCGTCRLVDAARAGVCA